MNTFGEHMRMLRKAARLSLGDLKRALDWRLLYLSNVECDVISPPADADIVRLAGVLGAEPSELLALAGRERKPK